MVEEGEGKAVTKGLYIAQKSFVVFTFVTNSYKRIKIFEFFSKESSLFEPASLKESLDGQFPDFVIDNMIG